MSDVIARILSDASVRDTAAIETAATEGVDAIPWG
jgi:hypothetical protein